MNGKLSKRIRLAAKISGIPSAQLKREYRALPYHRRKIAGVHVDGHSELLRRTHYYRQ